MSDLDRAARRLETYEGLFRLTARTGFDRLDALTCVAIRDGITPDLAIARVTAGYWEGDRLDALRDYIRRASSLLAAVERELERLGL